MTKEEAINTLGNFKRYISGGGVTDLKANEAIDMAIEALKGAEINCVHCPRYFETEDETGVYSHCQRPGDKKE